MIEISTGEEDQLEDALGLVMSIIDIVANWSADLSIAENEEVSVSNDLRW